MRILLLGADGQVGQQLRQTLAACGEVTCVTRRGGGDDQSCDLSDGDAVRNLLSREQPELIVNAAAYTAVDKAEEDSDMAMALNADLPRLLGEVVKQWDGRVLHYSTDYVFDGFASRPYVETDMTGPLGVYGRSKLEGEKGLAATGSRHLILRTAWVYGMTGRNFLTTMLRLAHERDHLRVVDDQHGSPTSAPFLAKASATIIDGWYSRDTRDRNLDGIYHLTTGGQTTWRGFAAAIVDEAVRTGKLASALPVIPITTSGFPTPATRPAYSVLDCTKVADMFRVKAPDWRSELHRIFAATP